MSNFDEEFYEYLTIKDRWETFKSHHPNLFPRIKRKKQRLEFYIWWIKMFLKQKYLSYKSKKLRIK